MEIKKLSELPLNKTNPFAEKTIAQMGNVLVSKKVLGANKDEGAILKAIDQNGEVLGGTAFIRDKVVDQEQFIKFYFAGVKAFFELKPATLKVFSYILGQLLPNKDMFVFMFEDAINHTKLGKTSIYKALTELCNHDIIARAMSDNLYFINPMMVFNGDRITFATQFINKNHPDFETSRRGLRSRITEMKHFNILPPSDSDPK